MRTLTLLTSSLLLSATVAGAMTPIETELSSHPNPGVVAFYQSNADTTEALYATTTDSSLGTAERMAAFTQLAIEYPIAGEVAARKLVGDSDTEIALTAVEFIKGAVVMSDHQMPATMDGFSPLVLYTMRSHGVSRAALRDAVIDERPELREASASFLASLSDMTALEAITSNVELYSDAEAAALITLSSGEESLALLERYIGSEDTGAQATSVEYLGAFPQYQSRIRSEVFLNGEMDASVRSAAADALSLYDSDFASYALIVTGEQDVSPELYSSVISGYVDLSLSDGRLGPEAAGNFANQINSYIESLEDPSAFSDAIGEIQSIEQRLQSVSNF